MDASGNLYGTTSSGGAGGEGAVFELSPSAAAPTVTGISPAAGAMSGGTTVTITGTNLAGATAVMFGNVAATSFTVNSNTQIMATSPAGTAITASTVDVTVVTAGGTSTTSSADQFAYVLPPVITGISPASGPEAGGTTVIITGMNLTGATSVNFFGMEMEASSFTVNSATQITATSPNGAILFIQMTPGPGSTTPNSFTTTPTTLAGTVATIDVTVTTAGGVSFTSPADQFTYIAAPTAPAAPTGLAASKDTYADKVQVTWTASAGATGYDVYRNTTNSSGTATKLNASDITTTTYDDTAAVPDVTYYYWIVARNSAGSSVFSTSDTGLRTAMATEAEPE